MVTENTATEATQDPRQNPLVGRGVREGGRLFRDWYGEQTAASESGGLTAYTFVMGSLNEILQTFDFTISFPEMNALQTAIRRVADEYLSEAEDFGYSPDICGYVKADVALQARGGEHPMGRIPKPSIAIMNNACNTYIKWAEIWERQYGIPILTFDVPGTRSFGQASQPGSEDFKAEHAYVLAQLKELIGTCEEVTGKKFDIDKFRQVLGYANDISLAWQRVVELNRQAPAVYNALTDGTVFLGMANGFRGTKAGSDYFKGLVEEMEFKAKHKIGVLHKTDEGLQEIEEKFRLSFIGVPCYPIFRRFNDLFINQGGIFVSSSYLWFASGGTCTGWEYDLDRPLESFAEGVLLMVREAMDAMFHQVHALVNEVESFTLDGAVFHPIKSCRTVSTGLADQRRFFSNDLGVPTLFMESDMMDKQVVSEAQMKNRVDAYFEGLNSRRQKAAV